MASRRFSFVLIAVVICFNASGQRAVDSLDIKIGQMLLIGFPGPQVDKQVLEEVRRGKVGSIILFEKNIPAKNSFAALKKIVWAYQEAAPIPLFICIDQEGGRVNRLKEKYGFPRSITAEEMGNAGTLDSVRFYSEMTAATLAGLGINMNFAPVVDLASNPNNPIIARYGRAFSANEDSVSMFAAEFVKGHRKFNVFTSLKHFPGHGSSQHDTHLGIADVTNFWEERELVPYKQLIAEGYADAVMTAHIVNKKLDAEGKPGTLSDNVVDGILRKRFHFDGVVFTDDMQMHAIAKHYGVADAIRLAILAGVDIMTFSNNISGSDKRTVDVVHGIIRNLVNTGVISEERIDQSFDRIMKLKRQLAADDRVAELKREVEELKASLENAVEAVREANQAIQETEEEPKDDKKKSRRKSAEN